MKHQRTDRWFASDGKPFSCPREAARYEVKIELAREIDILLRMQATPEQIADGLMRASKLRIILINPKDRA